MFLQSRAGVQIVGSRFSPDTQRLREFAARNRLAHAWIDLDNDPAAAVLLDSAGVHPGDTPVVLFEGTGVLRRPSNAQFAQAAGITGEPASGRTYDLIVIGAGPGGLAAAVYGASEGLTAAAVDAVAAGGQASTTSRIENYLGFPTGVSGAEFGERALLQAVRFGTQMFAPPRWSGQSRVLYGVAATATDVWAVGYGPCVGPSVNCPSKALTMHLTSAGWKVVPGVSVSDQQNRNTLAGVAITSGPDVWAVGDYFPAAEMEPIFALLEKQQGSGWVTR